MRLPGNSAEVPKELVLPAKKHFSTQKSSSVVNDVQELARTLTVGAEQIPSEIWMTFIFTLVVGAFLFVGGIYLVYSGSVNHVTDFVVLGSCGSLVGLCFISVGSIVLMKSVCRSRKERCSNQVKNETNSLLISYFPDGQTRIVTLQRTDPLANRRQESVDSGESSNNRTTAKSRKHRVSIKGNVYDNFPSTPAASPTCDDASNTQPPVQLNHVCLPVNGIAFRPKESGKDRLILNLAETQKAAVDKVSTFARGATIRKQTTLVTVSPLSVLSKRSADSWKTYQESLTVVVAEVHAEPGSCRSSLRGCASVNTRQQDIHESLLSPSPSPSYEDEDEMFPLDFIAGDSASRPDTGVGESISEEDFPFFNDDRSFSYRMLNSDAENSDDELMATAMDDPLIFNHGNGAEHGYMFNKCHAITEVLVHSG